MIGRALSLGILLCAFIPGAAPGAPAKDERLTADNYEKIKAGMTAAEVKEILGPPRMTATSGANHDMSMEWRPKAEPSHKIEVRFTNGIVTSKFANIDWAGQAAKLTADQFKPNFQKLSLGMTEQDAAAIMGITAKTEHASGGRSGMTWTIDAKWAYAIFQDGKAIELDSSETPPRNHDITPANYRRIVKGMDLPAVEAILGAATEKDPQADRYTWQQEKTTLTVFLRNGKVTSKTSTIKDVPLVHFAKTADDKFDAQLANLAAPDVSKRARAIEYFDNAPYDAARAREVSALLVRCLSSSKDARITMPAEHAARKWATKEDAGYFLKIIEHLKVESSGLEKNFGQIDMALDVLSRLKVPEAVPPMVRLLKRFFNRDEAVNALRKMGPELAEKELQKAANDPDYEVRKRVDELLAEFRDGGPLLAFCLKDLKSPSWELRLQAVQQIGKMYVNPKRRAEVVKALEGLQADPNGNVVKAAKDALGRWGGAGD